MKPTQFPVWFFAFPALLHVASCSSDSDGTPAGGASSTAGASGSQAGAAGSSGTASTAGAPNAGACDPKYTCAKAITGPNNDPSQLCDGTPAQTKFNDLQACLCTGACMAKCADSVCAQQMPSVDCLGCITDVNAGCGTKANDCAAN